jgi:hypothetical protein
MRTLILSAAGTASALGQAPHGPRVLPPGPMIDGGRITLHSSALAVDILKYSGTVARLSPTADPALDYTPGDLLKERSADTYYHLGDLDVRFRTAGVTAWTDVSTAFHREPVTAVTSDATHFSSRRHAPQDRSELDGRRWRFGASVYPDQYLRFAG